MSIRLALTMRVTHAPGYSEVRDAIAWDWGRFLAAALPDSAWMPVPNLGQAAPRMLEAFGITGLILTGGDSLGVHPERDATETTLLRWALSRAMPVLGVCRGAQLINIFQGGEISEAPRKNHVSSRHPVCLEGGSPEVNSYHHFVIGEAGLGKGLEPFAVCGDGTVEGFSMEGSRIKGIVWHPERESAPAAHDVALLRRLFLEVPQ